MANNHDTLKLGVLPTDLMHVIYIFNSTLTPSTTSPPPPSAPFITGIKSGQIGSLALDVYEHESELFFEDLSSTIVQDDRFQRLHTFNNVLITGHQGIIETVKAE